MSDALLPILFETLDRMPEEKPYLGLKCAPIVEITEGANKGMSGRLYFEDENYLVIEFLDVVTWEFKLYIIDKKFSYLGQSKYNII
jgi:RNase P/RNase MRP subunit p29